MNRFLLLIFVIVIHVATPAPADDWPQWRGPDRNGTWHEQGIVTSFKTDSLPAKWRVPVGSGYNGPTVSNGRVYVMDRVTDPTPLERVLCLDLETGQLLWHHDYDCQYKGIQYKAGPRASVTIDGDRAYAFGAMANLFCLDTRDGTVIWQKDMVKAYSPKVPIWGFSGSPFIYNDLVIMQVGGQEGACIVALDKRTGIEVWRALDDKASYSSPIVIEQAGKPVLVYWTGGRVAGLNPATGQVYWEIPFAPERMVINIADPVYRDGTIFLSGFYDGSMLIKLDPKQLSARIAWRRIGKNEKNTGTALHCCISTPILRDKYIYGVDSYGQLRCLDRQTGDRIWEDLTAVPKARWANIHMVQQADHDWFFNERGELLIGRLTPQGYQEISRAKIIEPTTAQLGQRNGVCWSHPAFANQCIFARNDKELICVDLSQP